MEFDDYPAPAGKLSVHDKLGEIMARPQGKALVYRTLEQAEKHLAAQGKSMPKVSDVMLKMASGMRVTRIISMLGAAVPAEAVKTLNAELNKIDR